ncbi:hypothetical protein [Bradyrhizobium sp. RT10b]|uniref:hypothetical protein n=1 Tax=unclassified Bradyrhizobium TaxID=2631580 RepID=UPI003397F7EC
MKLARRAPIKNQGSRHDEKRRRCNNFIASLDKKCVASRQIMFLLQPGGQSSLRFFQCQHRWQNVRCLSPKQNWFRFID